jgi:hypothetical protein
MRKICIPVLLSFLSCSQPPDEPIAGDQPMMQEILGRWDVTVQGDDSYPLWFELVQDGETFTGSFQPRGGHTLPLDGIEITDDGVNLLIGENTYKGSVENDRWEGTGRLRDGSTLKWTATRAPELAPPDDPQWGEPIQLFNGNDLTGWKPRHPSQPNMWKAVDGVLVNQETGSDLVTEAEFDDFKLHIEVSYPEGSNSGIYLRGRYEIQVQDDYGKEPHSRYLGGIYGRVTPTENAAKPAGEWQVFEITLLGRWATVTLNGRTIIDHKEIAGITGGALDSNESEPGPLMFQGDHGPVSYRNIILRPAR